VNFDGGLIENQMKFSLEGKKEEQNEGNGNLSIVPYRTMGVCSKRKYYDYDPAPQAKRFLSEQIANHMKSLRLNESPIEPTYSHKSANLHENQNIAQTYTPDHPITNPSKLPKLATQTINPIKEQITKSIVPRALLPAE
jgi:hypothetical protein